MSVIVVGADGSDESLCAVEWATEEAARRGLPLRIVHAEAEWLYDTPVDPRHGAVREWLLTGGQELLGKAAATARQSDPGAIAAGGRCGRRWVGGHRAGARVRLQ